MRECPGLQAEGESHLWTALTSAEAKLAEAGATVQKPASDVGGGRLVATFTDLDGDVLGLIQG
ncbi:hypothetical protein [Streptomyces sp. NBC_00151]|uniref:hypothetical protein n=1 Tax=Streptomyces sp. NBC_00151 TaxID=2975669 RepID=UPI002DDBF06C|nr:hypothetical protein [Streptomyces sp. NBC_00151]